MDIKENFEYHASIIDISRSYYTSPIIHYHHFSVNVNLLSNWEIVIRFSRIVVTQCIESDVLRDIYTRKIVGQLFQNGIALSRYSLVYILIAHAKKENGLISDLLSCNHNE